MKLFISAGEASGDHHAARVVRRFLQTHGDAEVTGICGPEMRAAGASAMAPMEALNVMGVTDVLRAIRSIRAVEARVLEGLRAEPPEAAVLVDFPGFHMRLGRQLRAMGIPVIQYIAPKLWAWGRWRMRALKRAQDRLACILPFEPAWFARYGVHAAYVGNPSAVECRVGWDRQALRRRLGLPSAVPLLALFPGSRPQELTAHLDLLVGVWEEAKRCMPALAGVVVRAPTVEEAALEPLRRRGVAVLDRQQEGFAMPADAAVAVSGTATLELALWGVPTVLVYRGSRWTVRLARRLVKVDHIGLANLLLGRGIMPELIQEEARTDLVLRHLLPLLRGEGEAQRRAFASLRAMLGKRDPAAGVVQMIETFHN